MEDLSPFFNTAVSANCTVFGFDGQRLHVLTIRRLRDPYKGAMALPGRLLLPDEDVETVAMNSVKSLTGFENPYHKEVRAFGNTARHPAGRVLSVAYYALVRMADANLQDSAYGSDPQWFPLDEIPILAFDHNEIVKSALRRLRKRLRSKPVGLELLPEKFTLPQLHRLYEDLFRTEIDKRNFRRKILASDIFVPLDEFLENGQNRPPRLYRADQDQYADWRKNRSSFAPDL
jgi:8-oxo-dGTP diphosphatase